MITISINGLIRGVQFLLHLRFKLSFTNEVTLKDNYNNTLIHIKQKMFAFKEEIKVCTDENNTNLAYNYNL